MMKWAYFLQLPHDFILPMQPTTRAAFFHHARAAKLLPEWRTTLMAKANYTAAEAAAVCRTNVAFETLVQAAPFP
jgi:hypothetical protein